MGSNGGRLLPFLTWAGSPADRILAKPIGVLFGCFARKIDGPGFTWWFKHLPGPSISPKRTPIVKPLQAIAGCFWVLWTSELV